ncbi:MAG: hypothetical protein AB3N23_19075 [Paracoccaceae bacterium]
MEAWIGPAIVAAFISAVITVSGWVLTGRREIASERRRRAERRADVQTALLAEIQHYVDILSNPEFDLNAVWETVVNEMEDNADYVPLIPSERNDTVFRAILGDIHVLPADVIQPVVRYYNQVFAIDAMITDLRGNGFATAEQDQRIKMYTDYIALKIEARSQGQRAIEALQHSLGEGHTGPAQINSRAGGPSGPSQGAEI